MRAAILIALLTGCPAVDSEPMSADCCHPADAGPCEWEHVSYTVPRYTESLASDARACRSMGLEPYRGGE